MKNKLQSLSSRLTGQDPAYCYASVIALITFLYLILEDYAAYFYDQLLIIPCVLFLGSVLSRGITPASRKRLVLPFLMVLWFTFLQFRRSLENGYLYSYSLFFCTYLFAYPLASLTQDSKNKKYLKLFAGMFVAAGLCLSGYGVLLLLDLLPDFLTNDIYWDGARLLTFCHPNILACFLMIGIVFCSALFAQAETRFHKAGSFTAFLVLLAALALTNCRSAILLVSLYLGSGFYFLVIKKGYKWFLPGLAVTLVLGLLIFSGFGKVFLFHQDALLQKYASQYAEQIQPETPVSGQPAEDPSGQSGSDFENGVEIMDNEEYSDSEYEDDASQTEETLPFNIDPETGEISLKVTSGQGSFLGDLGTLNSRTYIWDAARFAIRENPSILLYGVDQPGHYVSYYNFFYSAHTHNSWIECLMGLGLPGFLIAMAFTLSAIWNSLVILLKHHQDIWKRNVAILTLCLLVVSFVQPYLFFTTIYYQPADFIFFLCAGYLSCWQEEDNRQFLQRIRQCFTK